MGKEEKRLTGVCPILPTPFQENGEIDVASLKREVEFLIESGVSGIALFGNASEAFALKKSEKELIAKTVVEVCRGRVRLVFGSGSTGTELAIENSLWAAENGADILMIMPPYMIKPDAQRTYEYFAAIASAVDKPIMIQDAPGACGVTMSVDTIVRLVENFENICYVKAEAPPTFQKAKKIIDALGDKVSVFGGLNATFFYEELCCGVCGTMPAGEFPEVLVRVYDRFVSGDRKGAREEFYKYLPFIRLGSIPGGMAMAVHKEILKKGGIFTCASVRNPYVPADGQLIGLVYDALDGLTLDALTWGERHAQ